MAHVVIRRLVCRLLGHSERPARRLAPWLLPTVGLVGGWETCEPAESRGVGCTRCGRYVEHEWVGVAHELGLDP
jgi:hypothetical protein